MKLRSSLFAKILGWFFLNLVLVAVALSVFFTFQPQINLHRIFGEQAKSRLQTAGRLMVHDLGKAPQEQWPEVLARHAEIHRVDFAIVFDDGALFSSTDGDLPDAVMARIKKNLRDTPPRGPRMPRHGRRHPMRPWQNRPADGLSNHAAIEKVPLNPPELRSHIPHFTMRTKHPTRYWSGIHIPPPRGPMHRPTPAMLLAVSDSVTGNGFFFDPLPWMVVAAAVILISALLWIPMVRNITRPLRRMTGATEEIAQGRFDVTIHEPRTDEIGRLAKAIRHMSARLSAFVHGQKRFLSDVAHELGSPIARIQFGLGALAQRINGENRQRVTDVLADVDHLSKLVNELLTFSRAEMKSESVHLERIDLAPTIATAVKREAIPSVRINVDVDPQIQVVASAELLIRAFANILRNAVKYAGDDGPVSITATQTNGRVEIVISDLGPGVPADTLDQLFEPFFRPEASRNQESGGVGLGMAIVKTCIETCQGTVSAVNRHPNGFAVIVTLNM